MMAVQLRLAHFSARSLGLLNHQITRISPNKPPNTAIAAHSAKLRFVANIALSSNIIRWHRDFGAFDSVTLRSILNLADWFRSSGFVRSAMTIIRSHSPRLDKRLSTAPSNIVCPLNASAAILNALN